MNKILIVDGHAFAFRAYYAFQTANLTNSLTGKPSGAVFGFFRMLFKILQDFQPTHLVVPFDPGTRLERNDQYEEYKANRKPMPEDLKEQVEQIKEMCRDFGFSVLIEPGQEADDIIGTLSELYAKDGNEIIIFSGDKDMFQLLKNDSLTMLRGKKGVTEFNHIKKDTVKEMLGVGYEQVVDFMGLVGDSSDNIPGVKGIGEKGAATLLNQYANLEQIYENLDAIKSKATRQKLIDHKEMAFLSRKLATIRTDLPLKIKLDDLKLTDYQNAEKLAILQREGFNTLYRDMSRQAGIAGQEALPVSHSLETLQSRQPNYILINTIKQLKEVIAEFKKKEVFCIDTETTAIEAVRAELLGFSLCCQANTAYYVSVSQQNSLFTSHSVPIDEAIKLLKPLLANTKTTKIGQNIKYDMIVLKKYGIEFKGELFDTMLASYIIQSEGRRHGMDALARDYLNYKTITYSELVGSGKKKRNLFEIDPQEVKDYACEDADITFQLYQLFSKKLAKLPTKKILDELETPLVPVLVETEAYGVKIDIKYFAELSQKFQKKIDSLEKSIYQLANKTFNIASTRELQQVLFEDLNLPPSKKTASGYSTDHSVMESLLGMHPIIDDILEYRKYTKLHSTYIEALPKMVVKSTGRIHTSYLQTVAATGRLSSVDPNLQNIPIKDEEGRMIRKGFIAETGYSLLSLDYSQIELRIMAHFSDDEKMIQAYKNHQDIHAQTAAAIYGVEQDEVSKEMRNKAKAVNFSVIYGITPFGLSKSLKISRQEAKSFIDTYLATYPGVQKFMTEICAKAQKDGYVETLNGRRRYIPTIQSTRKQEQEAGKRIAINSPIQGTSADMIKMAMIRIHNKIQKKKLKSRLIMQVHDELVFEVHNQEKEEIYEMAKSEMEKVIRLKVPIIVEGKFGKNWEQAH